MILYGSDLSALCAKIAVVLAVKGIESEWRDPPSEASLKRYENIVWNTGIPAIVDGKFILSESDVIAEYLEESYPEPTLLPGDIISRSHIRYLSRYHDLYIEPPVRTLFGQLDPRKQDMDVILPVVEQLHLGLSNLEKLIKPQPYLASKTLSLADCGFPATLMQADIILDVLGMNSRSTTKILKWREMVEKNPAVESVMNEFRPTSIAGIERKLNMVG